LPYPRPGEPIVPHLLRPLVLDRRPAPRTAEGELLALVELGPRAWGRLPALTCQRLGLLVIDRVQTRLGTLPAFARRAPLPDPRTALTLPLERRTANTLRRELAEHDRDPPGPWTVERYLAIRRFGGRALVDLLAAVEARGGMVSRELAPGASPPSDVPTEQALHDLLVRVTRQLPLSEADAQAAVVREAGTKAAPELSDLVRTAVRLGNDVPFRALDLGGTRMLVRPSELTLAQTTYRLAARAVQGWGAVTVGAVTAQLHAAIPTGVSAAFVERLMIGIATFRWLDREAGWFWLLQPSNPLLAGVRKVLSVVPRLPLERLRAALLRARQGVTLSLEALRQICLAVPGTWITDGVVATARHDVVALSEAEQRLVKILRAARPTGIPDTRLRPMVRAVGLPWTPVLRLLHCSPLVERAPDGRFQLVGSV
jgi:hypothetical protein